MKKKCFTILILLFLLKGDTIMDFYEQIKMVKNPTNILVLVNKNHKLDKSYIPPDLYAIDIQYANEDQHVRKEVKRAFEALSKDAKELGYRIVASSTYRSYTYQETLYNYYVDKKGLQYADSCSARKGHSEHQTGLSIDVEGSGKDYDFFEKDPEFPWMRDNAYKYGFILRYPKEKSNITGFKYEPWHYRYVGKKVAREVFIEEITLEEYIEKNGL